jgi:formyltetrahydrofolate deformylase
MDLIVTLACNDHPGIVFAMTNAILQCDGNIIENQQFTDPATNTFVMRTRFETIQEFERVEQTMKSAIKDESAVITLREYSRKKKVLVLVTKESHCLQELLYLQEIGEMEIEIPLIVSNRNELSSHATDHNIEFHYLPISQNEGESKADFENQLRVFIAKHEIDLIVLARFMQILSDEFCQEYAGRIINIHHSFLPGFKGAKPYHQAYDRGVKIIGASAHFVTGDLDEGPIIAQDVAHVSHSATPDDLIMIGRDIERRVLSRAVRNYAQDRIFIVGNRTVVFHD